MNESNSADNKRQNQSDVPGGKDKDEVERLRSIVSPVRDDLERTSRVQKALARLRARRTKEKKPQSDKDDAA